MRQLSDKDIAEMVGSAFAPDDESTRKKVRAELKLSQRIPHKVTPLPEHAVLDLHQLTEEQAWQEIMSLATSGIKQATIITGASGILHKKFPVWATESILSPYIVSAAPINNGSFQVKFKRKNN